MIVVTGGAGFIGSNVVHALNRRGVEDILVVDDLSDPRKVENIASASFADYLDRDEFAHMVATSSVDLRGVRHIIHQGATTSTTEHDGRAVMANNHGTSRALLRYCTSHSVPIIYASSAAVYGASTSFSEDRVNEHPLNVYGLSKLLTDQIARRSLRTATSQVVGLRYFNVYGPGEAHKDDMASMILQLDDEVCRSATATIFGPSHGFTPGAQRRDFVHVEDVVDVVLWFMDHPELSGVFNCGSGDSQPFVAIAQAVIAARGSGVVRFKEMPAALARRYQPKTLSDNRRLRAAGYQREFRSVLDAIPEYLRWRDHWRGV